MTPKIPKSLLARGAQEASTQDTHDADLRAVLDALQANWSNVSLTAEQMRAVRRLGASIGHPLGNGDDEAER